VIANGFTCNAAVYDLLPTDAVTVTACEDFTTRWLTVKYATRLVPVSFTVIEAGTVATDVMLLLNLTITPLVGVGPLKVKAPAIAACDPPITDGEDRVKLCRVAARTVTLVVRVTPPTEAEIVTGVSVDSMGVVTAKTP